MKNFLDRDYWSGLPDEFAARSVFQPYFDRWLPRSNGEAVEIGAWPGTHLAALTRSHGYRPVALDYQERVRALAGKFSAVGLPSAETIQADFLTWETGRRFAVVMSFGFVEHFDDPPAVVRRHWDLVEPGGYMVVGVPLFGKMQWWLRRTILKPEKLKWVMDTHNLSILGPGDLARSCAGFGGREVFAGPVMRMHTWFRLRNRFIRPTRLPVLLAWKMVSLVPLILNRSSDLYSPYCLVILQRD